MSIESKLQSKIRQYLRSKGCYVLVITVGPGIPDGCPDILFMLEGFWGALEVKASAQAQFQPLQEHTLLKLDKWSYAKVVFPEIWSEVKEELEAIL